MELKFIYWLIPLAFLLIVGFMLFPNLFGQTKGAVQGIVSSVKIGAVEVSSERIAAPPKHTEAVKRLVETIEKMQKSPRENCFAPYGGLPSLGEQGTALILSRDRIEVSRNGQIVEDLMIELKGKMKGFKPCLIAGSREITQNFYDYFLAEAKVKIDKPSACVESGVLIAPGSTPEIEKGIGVDICPEEGILEEREIGGGQYYYPLNNQIEISYYEGKSFLCRNANIIRAPELGAEIVNDNCHNFEDGGWLFKAADGRICFFPTHYTRNEEGLKEADISLINLYPKKLC